VRSLKKIVEERGGKVVLLQAGDYVTIPMLDWHAAYNHERTFSVNNVELSIWDIPKLLHHTIVMNFDKAKGATNMDWFKGTQNVGSGILAFLVHSSNVAFPGAGLQIEMVGKELKVIVKGRNATQYPPVVPFQQEMQLLERRGAWMSYLSKSLELSNEMEDFCKEKGYTTARMIQGWSRKFRDGIARWLKTLICESIENKNREKKRKGPA
jgi:hypothetical protein